MSGYSQALSVEDRGKAIVLPYLKTKADGQLVLLENGVLAKYLQHTIGDLIMSVSGHMWTVECKFESRYTGNLFLELWSNRNLESRGRHADVGATQGWFMSRLRADILLAYFIDTDRLFAFDLFRLKQWALRHDSGRVPYVFRYPVRKQSKYSQLNDTWGWCVPIGDIRKGLTVSEVSVKQLGLI